MLDSKKSKDVQIYLAGVGGQGIISTGRLLLDIALAEGYTIHGAETHGMSQRGGAVEFHVRIGNFSAATIPKGKADIVLAMEPIEMVRSLEYLKDNGIIIVNTKEIIPNFGKITKKKYPNFNDLLQEARKKTSKITIVPANKMAEEVNNSKGENLILLGVMNSLVKLFNSNTFEQKISERWPKLAEKNISTYKKGIEYAIKQLGNV